MPWGYTFSHVHMEGTPSIAYHLAEGSLSFADEDCCYALGLCTHAPESLPDLPEKGLWLRLLGKLSSVLTCTVVAGPWLWASRGSWMERVSLSSTREERCGRALQRPLFVLTPSLPERLLSALLSSHSQGGKLSGPANSRSQARREINVLCPGLPPRGPQGRALSQLLWEVTLAI